MVRDAVVVTEKASVSLKGSRRKTSRLISQMIITQIENCMHFREQLIPK